MLTWNVRFIENVKTGVIILKVSMIQASLNNAFSREEYTYALFTTRMNEVPLSLEIETIGREKTPSKFETNDRRRAFLVRVKY